MQAARQFVSARIPRAPRGLIFQQRSHHLDHPLAGTQHRAARQIHRQVFRMRTNQLPQIALRQPVNHPPDARPVSRSGTHRARFGAGVQRAPGQEIRRIGNARARHQHPFRMAGPVARVAMRVARFHQHGPIRADQNRAERMIPRRPEPCGRSRSTAEDSPRRCSSAYLPGLIRLKKCTRDEIVSKKARGENEGPQTGLLPSNKA